MTLPELLLTWYLLEQHGFLFAFNQDVSLHEANLLVEKSATAIESHSEKMFGNMIDHEKGRIVAEIVGVDILDEILAEIVGVDTLVHILVHTLAGIVGVDILDEIVLIVEMKGVIQVVLLFF